MEQWPARFGQLTTYRELEGDGSQLSYSQRREVQVWKGGSQNEPLGLEWNRRHQCRVHDFHLDREVSRDVSACTYMFIYVLALFAEKVQRQQQPRRNEHTQCSVLTMSLSAKSNQGSLQKWLTVGLEQRKMSKYLEIKHF